MVEEPIDFKEAVKVRNQKKILELKKRYFEYLKIQSEERIDTDKMFILDYEEEINAIKIKEGINSLLNEWKIEFNNKFNTIDNELLEEIKQEIVNYQWHGRDTIFTVLRVKFLEKISEILPSNVDAKEYLRKMIEDYFNDIIK